MKFEITLNQEELTAALTQYLTEIMDSSVKIDKVSPVSVTVTGETSEKSDTSLSEEQLTLPQLLQKLGLVAAPGFFICTVFCRTAKNRNYIFSLNLKYLINKS